MRRYICSWIPPHLLFQRPVGKIAHKSPSTSRPFLRRQESLFHVPPTAAAIGGEMADSYRLLQARHCEIPAYAGMVCGGTGNCWWILALLAAYDCEIPAFAGMVCGGTRNCWWILALLAVYDCEIPAFAGMVCEGTGVCVDFGVVVRPPPLVAALRQGDSCLRRNGPGGESPRCRRRLRQ